MEVPRTPSFGFRHQSQVQVITFTSDQLAINQRVPRTSSSGSINLLEQPTELKDNILLITAPIYYKKDRTPEQPTEEMHRVRVCGKGAGIP